MGGARPKPVTIEDVKVILTQPGKSREGAHVYVHADGRDKREVAKKLQMIFVYIWRTKRIRALIVEIELQ